MRHAAVVTERQMHAIKAATAVSPVAFKMSRATEHCRPCRPFSRPRIVSLLILFLLTLSLSAMSSRTVGASPLPDLVREYQSLVSEGNSADNSTDDSTDDSSSNNSTEIATDVYVIKAVVYEIGILTDTDNTTSESTERQERVDISLYDPPRRDDEFS